MKARTLIQSSLIVALSLATPLASASERTAHVDLQRVIDDSQAGQAANARVEVYADGITKRVDAALAAAQKAKGSKDEVKKAEEATGADQHGAVLIKQAEAREKKTLMDHVYKIVGQLAKAKHYKNVDGQAFLYSEDDLTAAVITQLDAETSAATEAAAKAEAAKAAADAKTARAETATTKAENEKLKAENDKLRALSASVEKK